MEQSKTSKPDALLPAAKEVMQPQTSGSAIVREKVVRLSEKPHCDTTAPTARVRVLKVERVLCFIAGVDYDTISTCPKTDQLWASHLGLALTLSFLVVFGITFHATSYIIAGVPIRCIAAFVIALTVLMFDRALFQSDWFFQPVLSAARTEPSRWLRIALRLGISFCLSFALALFLELAIFSDTIAERLQEEFRTANAFLFQEMADYQARMEQEVADRSEQVRELENALSKVEANSGQQVAQLQAKLLALDEKIAVHVEDRNAERYGQQTRAGQTGRAGQGAAFRFAQAQINDLTDQKRQLQSQVAALRAADTGARERLKDQLDSARRDLSRLMETKDADLLGYRRNIVEDSPEFLKLKDDPLARMAAYTELKKDPKEGPSIIFLSWLLRFSVMFLEVVPLVAKMLFGPPTVYATKIRAVLGRERQRAEEGAVSDEERREQATEEIVKPGAAYNPVQPLRSQLDASKNLAISARI